MLVQLGISNFAIIRHLDIAFKPGLNILSGETGTGKTILINAVNLVLGGRASTDLVRSGSAEARVEALFSVPEDSPVRDLLRELGLTFEGGIVVRRTLSREGRSRVQINDSLATLQTLSRLGGFLISVSGQHEHQLLLRPENHLFILDDFGGLTEARLEVGRLFDRWRDITQRKKTLEAEIKALEERQDLARFQVQEISQANIEPGEDEALAQEKKRLQHAGELQEIVLDSYRALYERTDSVISVLSQCVRRIEKATAMDSRLGRLREALEDIRLRTEDAALTLRDLERSVKGNPRRLEEVEERIQLLHRLKRKYGPTLADVLAFGQRASCQVEDLEKKKDGLTTLTREGDFALRDLKERALALSRERRVAAAALEKAVIGELKDLHMSGTAFKVLFHSEGEAPEVPGAGACGIGPDGMDQVAFMIAPNIGEDLKPLARIASGGELSRIMLALKTILAREGAVETVIFDEVDTGISGATAEMIGEKLLALSRFHQVLCITHLPQIACKGKNHLLVRKEVSGGRTETVVSDLDGDSRVREIARLLGGKEITKKAMAHAEEMIRGRPGAAGRG